jgi:hypothetical protein
MPNQLQSNPLLSPEAGGALNSVWQTSPNVAFMAAMRGRGLFGAMAMKEEAALEQQKQQQLQQFLQSQPITGETPGAQLRSKALVYERAGLLGQAKQLSQMANDLEPHETYGAPTTVLQNGQPRLALPGSRGNMRVVEGASPYERGDEAELGRILDQAGIKDEALRRPIFKALADKKVSHAPGVTINNQAETAYATTVGKGGGESDLESHKGAQSAADALQGNINLLEHLRTGDTNTGMAAELRTNIDRLKVLFAANEKAGKRVSDTQLSESMMGSDVFSMIQSLGIGARGLDTPAEREFMRNVLTGTTSLDKDTLIRMASIRKNILERAVDKFNSRVERGELDAFFRARQSPRQKIEKPTSSTLPKSEYPTPRNFPTPPPAAINDLKMRPNSKEQFDAVFGPGAADRVLGQ